MYEVLKSMKVQDADGNIRIAKPGEDVPEADTWRNRRSWIDRGFIKLKAGTTSPPPPNTAKPVRPATPPKPEPKPEETADTEESYTESQLLKMSKGEVQVALRDETLGDRKVGAGVH